MKWGKRQCNIYGSLYLSLSPLFFILFLSFSRLTLHLRSALIFHLFLHFFIFPCQTFSPPPLLSWFSSYLCRQDGFSPLLHFEPLVKCFYTLSFISLRLVQDREKKKKKGSGRARFKLRFEIWSKAPDGDGRWWETGLRKVGHQSRGWFYCCIPGGRERFCWGRGE